MSESLEQVALRIAREMGDINPWGLEEFARRLVAALGAQEPVAWLDRKGTYVSIEANEKYGTGVIKLYAAPQLPREGWQLVPVNPTPEMVKAIRDSGYDGNTVAILVDYKAMLAAAPKPEATP